MDLIEVIKEMNKEMADTLLKCLLNIKGVSNAGIAFKRS